jgi:hypothetical protein
LAEPAAPLLGWRVAALFHPYAIRPFTEKILVIASSSKLPKHAVSQIFFSLSSNLCVPASSGQIGFGTQRLFYFSESLAVPQVAAQWRHGKIRSKTPCTGEFMVLF